MSKGQYTQEEIDEMGEARNQIAEALETLKRIARDHSERYHQSYVLAHLDVAVGEGEFVDTSDDTLAKWIAEAEANRAEEDGEGEDEEEESGTLCACCSRGDRTLIPCPGGCGELLCQDCVDQELHSCEPA